MYAAPLQRNHPSSYTKRFGAKIVRDCDGIPILMYHEVASTEELAALKGKTQHSYIVTREQFHEQMAALRSGGANTISLDQLIAWQQNGTAVPKRSIVITFDDGFSGNERHALPILREFGFTATFFIVTNKIGDNFMMSWEQLRMLASNGMAIGSHTASHPLLSALDSKRTQSELQDSKESLQQGLGLPVKHFSLPNGDTNPHYRTIASQLGYASGCGSTFGLNDQTTEPYFLRRIAIKAATPTALVNAIAARDRNVLRRLSYVAGIKSAIPRIIGKPLYNRFYNFAFGVEEQEKS
jgi:peptidoglycan/xylan/chitin deacetylase (PgdA/CDA1 family)